MRLRLSPIRLHLMISAPPSSPDGTHGLKCVLQYDFPSAKGLPEAPFHVKTYFESSCFVRSAHSMRSALWFRWTWR